MKKASIICCTENRPEFMPFTAHIFNAFRVPEGWEKELIVVDSSDAGMDVKVYESLERHVPSSQLVWHWYDHPKCTIAEKSNVGMELARQSKAELIGWLDDDDGRFPGWLAWAIEQLGDKDLLAVKTKPEFINIVMTPMKIRPPKGTKWWSAGIYRRSAVEKIQFLEKLPHGAPNILGQDVQWQGYCWQRVPRERQVHVWQEGVGFALSHRRNIANNAGKCATYQWKYNPYKPEMWTDDEWAVTLQEIHELRKRLHYA